MTAHNSSLPWSAGDAINRRLLVRAIYLLAMLLIAFLFTYRLGTFPSPYFDEGAYLNVARTYADSGIYAEHSLDGYRFNGAVVSTGPTVLVPIAALIKWFGFHVALARLVMVGYSLLMLAALFGISRHLGGRAYALVVLGLAIFGWGNQFFYLTRSIMGEVPGLALMLAGIWLWWSAERSTILRSAAVGLLFGLACVTKTQIALVLLPALLLAWLADLAFYRQHPWHHFVIPGALAGIFFFGWMYYSWYLLGASLRDPQADIETLRTAGSNSYFVLDPETNYKNFSTLAYGFSYAGLLIPAGLLGLTYALPRSRTGSRWVFLSLLLLGNAAMFVVSIGWLKNSVPALILGAFFVGKLLNEMFDEARAAWHRRAERLTQPDPSPISLILGLMLIGFALILFIVPVLRAIYDVGWAGGDAPYRVADYLTAHAPPQAVIETWDKELLNLSQHNFHTPPQVVETYRNLEVRQRGTAASERYDFRDYGDPDFVVVGPSSRKNGVYTSERLVSYTLITTIGEYDIYQKQAYQQNTP